MRGPSFTFRGHKASLTLNESYHQGMLFLLLVCMMDVCVWICVWCMLYACDMCICMCVWCMYVMCVYVCETHVHECVPYTHRDSPGHRASSVTLSYQLQTGSFSSSNCWVLADWPAILRDAYALSPPCLGGSGAAMPTTSADARDWNSNPHACPEHALSPTAPSPQPVCLHSRRKETIL